MPILSGAVAYRALPSDDVEKQISYWQQTRRYEGGAMLKEVLCPKCSELYVLLEEGDVTNEMLQEDLEFLAKALSSGHPLHPASMVIRDLNGVLLQTFQLPEL